MQSRVAESLAGEDVQVRDMVVRKMKEIENHFESNINVINAERKEQRQNYEKLRELSELRKAQEEYFKTYGLNQARLDLAKKDAIVMHPGPMNRGVEIDSVVADSEQSVILPQVTFGIAVRMAVMAILAGQHS